MVVSKHEAFELFFDQAQRKGKTFQWAKVDSVNADGTANVMLNESVSTRCACLQTVKANDRVLVALFDRKAVVLGKKV